MSFHLLVAVITVNKCGSAEHRQGMESGMVLPGLECEQEAR
jgi:hypothetical protein